MIFTSSSDPTITVTVTGGGNFEVGENISLSCDVSGTDNLAGPTINYMWLRDGVIIPSLMVATLMLGPLRTSDSESYSCRVTVSDNFLNNSINQTSEVVSINLRGEHHINYVQDV